MAACRTTMASTKTMWIENSQFSGMPKLAVDSTFMKLTYDQAAGSEPSSSATMAPLASTVQPRRTPRGRWL
jgi:hypothetical protein